MPIRIAYHCEITDDTAQIDRWLNQDVPSSRKFGDAIDFVPRIALKSKVIELCLDFILNYHKDERWILSGRSGWAKPDVMPPFQPAITNNGKATKRSVEIN